MTRRTRALLLTAALLVLWPMQAAAQLGRVAGQVRNEAGVPVPGATILIENPDAAPDSFRATSDRRGQFAVIGLRPGLWTITVAAPGHEPARVALRVSAIRSTGPIDLRLAIRAVPASVLKGITAGELQERLDRADALLVGGDTTHALAEYRAVLDRVPALTTVNLQIGRALRRVGDADGAAAAFEAAVRGEAGREIALVELTELEMARGNVEQAGKHASRLEEIAPGSPEAKRARALANREEH